MVATAATATETELSSAMTIAGIVTENGSGQNNTTEAEAAPSSLRATTPRYNREECPICLHVLPHEFDQVEYNICRGQNICNGCIVGRQRAELKERGKIIEGVTPEDTQFMLIAQHWSTSCPFCRHNGK